MNIAYNIPRPQHIARTKCLSTTSSANTHRVASLEGHRPSLRLDWSWMGKSLLEHLGQNVFRHGGFFERHDWLWNVVSFDDNLMGSSPVGSLLFTAFLHVGVFNVEVLFKWHQFDLCEIDILEIGPKIAATATSKATSSSKATTVATVASSKASHRGKKVRYGCKTSTIKANKSFTHPPPE